jgi:hypothetical protein
MFVNKKDPTSLTTAKNGYVRNNQGWDMIHILRDYEPWMDTAIQARLNEILDKRHKCMQRNMAKETQYHGQVRQAFVFPCIDRASRSV